MNTVINTIPLILGCAVAITIIGSIIAEVRK